MHPLPPGGAAHPAASSSTTQEYTEHDVDLSIFLPVSPGTTATAPLQVLELPARDCLVATVHGPYDQISAAHDQINQRASSDGLTPCTGAEVDELAFNIYLTTPDQVAPDQLVTEVCLPLQ